jgi:hypothetical protein
MLQGGMPPSTLKVIDRIFNDTGSIGDPHLSLLVTNGHSAYDYSEIDTVMQEVRRRDRERIALAASMNYGMKPRSNFCQM